MNPILNNQVRLRPEYGYMLAGMVSRGEIHEVTPISYWDGIVLMLCNGEKKPSDIAEIFCYLTGNEKAHAEKVTREVFNRYSRYFAQTKEEMTPISWDIPALVPWIQRASVAFEGDADNLTPGQRVRAPITIKLKMTNACEVECVYCIVDRQRYAPRGKLMPHERWLEIADEISRLQVFAVDMAGGDPLVYPKIDSFMRALNDRHISFHLTTKAHVTETQAKIYRDVGLEYVQFSLDTVDPVEGAFLMQRSGFVPKALESIRHLLAAGIHVKVNAVITRYNVRSVPDLLASMSQLRVPIVRLSLGDPSPYAADPNLDLEIPHEDIKWLKEIVLPLKQKYRPMLIDSTVDDRSPLYYPWENTQRRFQEFSERNSCGAGGTAMAIYPDGKVTGCEQTASDPDRVLGDLSYQSIEEVWNSESLMTTIHPPKDKFEGQVCQECLDFYVCHNRQGRCYIEADKAYGTSYAPMPTCPKAPRYDKVVYKGQGKRKGQIRFEPPPIGADSSSSNLVSLGIPSR